ncbi:MAG TPA: ABC transporter ATP-binding protein [Acidimicrobiales bacterium]
MTAILVDRVSVRIDDNVILRDVSLDVDPGGWVGVIGPNGAGKSTLLRAIAGLVPFEGSIALGDASVRALRPRERARLVALVTQSPIIPPAIAVADYVMLGRTPHIGLLGVETAADRRAVAEAMELLALTPLAARRVETLSGGERQRVFLARALAQQAPVLLLDEPTSALDIGHGQDVLELVDMLRAARELTVVMTMHDLTLAGRYADRLVLLSGGEVVTAGSIDDVLTEEHLARHYGASVRILRDEHGLVVIPDRRPREARR